MPITLTYQGTTINLDSDLRWIDEGSWQPVEQTAQRTITGALIVSTSARTAGRPITLQPDDDRSAWMQKSTVDTLLEWASFPGREFVLNLRGVNRDVIFRHQDGGVDATPIVHFSDVQPDDWYSVIIRFMEI